MHLSARKFYRLGAVKGLTTSSTYRPHNNASPQWPVQQRQLTGVQDICLEDGGQELHRVPLLVCCLCDHRNLPCVPLPQTHQRAQQRGATERKEKTNTHDVQWRLVFRCCKVKLRAATRTRKRKWQWQLRSGRLLFHSVDLVQHAQRTYCIKQVCCSKCMPIYDKKDTTPEASPSLLHAWRLCKKSTNFLFLCIWNRLVTYLQGLQSQLNKTVLQMTNGEISDQSTIVIIDWIFQRPI